MNTPTYNETLGISISVFKPAIDIAGGPTYTMRGQLVDGWLNQNIDSYNHEILANGGWWSASMSLSGSLVDMEDWFVNGLNRHIEVYNSALVKIWEGFVNQVALSAGTLQATRGPLMDIANRVSVVYSPILDATVAPPLEGSETTTTIANNTASQARYGIFEQVISGGKLLDDGTTDDATELRDTYLAENREPETGEEINLGSSATASVQIDLLGYVHRLQGWIYQNTVAATAQLDATIPAILAADPNAMFTAANSTIATNALLVSGYSDDNQMAWDVIQRLVSLGDAAGNRYTFGVYDNQHAIYAIAPTDTTAYQYRIAGESMDIETYTTGETVQPWDVLPARWMFLPDFLAGQKQDIDQRLDPRFLFIESVRFTAPSLVQVSGQKISRIPQMIARLGA